MLTLLLDLLQRGCRQWREGVLSPLEKKYNTKLVITELDIKNLQSNKVHRFYLRASELNSGAPIHVPVVVARGPGDAPAGKTIMLTATVHGDEVVSFVQLYIARRQLILLQNPIRVAQKVISGLDASRIT